MFASPLYHMPLTEYNYYRGGVLSNDGKFMCTVHDLQRYTLILHDMQSCVQRGFRERSRVDCICFSHCDQFLFVASTTGIEKWQLNSRSLVGVVVCPMISINHMSCSSKLFGCTGNLSLNVNKAYVWGLHQFDSPDYTNYNSHRTLSSSDDDCNDMKIITFHPDGNHIAVARQTIEDTKIGVWCAQSFLLLHELPIYGGISSLTYSPCGKYLATSGLFYDHSDTYNFDSHHICMWSVLKDTTYEHVKSIRFADPDPDILMKRNYASAMAFSPWSDFVIMVGRFLHSGGARYGLPSRIWKAYECELSTGKIVSETHLEDTDLRDVERLSCSYDSKGEKVVTGATGGTIVVNLAFCGKQRRQLISRHNYSLILLQKQLWWPSDISKLLKTYLLCE